MVVHGIYRRLFVNGYPELFEAYQNENDGLDRLCELRMANPAYHWHMAEIVVVTRRSKKPANAQHAKPSMPE